MKYESDDCTRILDGHCYRCGLERRPLILLCHRAYCDECFIRRVALLEADAKAALLEKESRGFIIDDYLRAITLQDARRRLGVEA